MGPVSYDSFFYYPESKGMTHESVNLKGVVYSENKTLSTFSLSPMVQLLQTLAQSSEQVLN